MVSRKHHEAALPSRQRPPITVDEACGFYREKVEDQTSWPTTRYILAASVAGLGSNHLLADVSQRDLQLFFAKRKKGRAPSTINREIDVLRAVWTHAAATRFDIGESPNWRSLRLKETVRPERELNLDEEHRLFAVLREDVCDAVEFLLKSGWRRNEVLNLRWRDCDFTARVAFTRIKGGDVVRRPLTDTLVSLIERQPRVSQFVFTYVCQRPSKRRKAGQRYHLTATALRKPFCKALREAKIEEFRLHDLRTRALRGLSGTRAHCSLRRPRLLTAASRPRNAMLTCSTKTPEKHSTKARPEIVPKLVA